MYCGSGWVTTNARQFGVILAALLLYACGSAPPAITPEAQPEPPVAGKEAVEPIPPPPPPPPAPRPVVKPDIRTLTVNMVGDMMLGTDYPENRLPDDDGASFLSAVASILASADLTIGNLEGTLVDGGTPAKECTNPAACYLFRSPSRYADHLVNAGFDVMSVANNHARDFGEDGRTETMLALATAGIGHTGRRGDFASLQINGLSVAVLGYAVTRNSNLLHDYERAADTIARFAAGYDIVIVSFHGGAEGRDVSRLPFAEEEYYGEPRGDVVRFARMAVDNGADLVFGHGPHVVRAMELYKDRLIAYSLGNFATYYGISVEGLRGIAPILNATLDYRGRFIEGEIVSTVQIRPGGPQPDPQQRALREIRQLSLQDFGNPGLQFADDGRLTIATN